MSFGRPSGFTDEQKAAAVAQAETRTQADVAREFGVTTQTIANWIARTKGKKPAPAPRVLNAQAALSMLGLDPEQWSIVHRSGVRLP